MNPTGVTGGGHIGPIGARGAIAGRIEAADTSHEIRSGDSVTATLIAPNVPIPIEFDNTIQADYPLPALPESIVAEILAQAAAEHAAVLATKAQVVAQIADLLADFAAERAAAAIGLADAIAQATANAAAAQIDAVLALGTDLDEATAAMDAAVAAAAAELAGLQDAVENSASSLEADRDQMQQARSDAYAQANSLASQVAAAMTESDTTIDESRSIVLNASIGLRASRETNWENIREYLASSSLAGWHHFPPPPDPPAGPSSRFTYSRFALAAVMHDLGLPEYQMAAERTLWGMDAANQGMETLGYLTPPGTLLLAGYKLAAGEELMGRRLTTGQKIFEAFNIGLVLTPVILASLSDLAPKGGTGFLTSPGVTVRKTGNYFIKEVDPNASRLARWHGERSLRYQSEALTKLGDMAPPHLLKNGKLITRDAGTYVPGNFWRTYAKGSWRLGTPVNDIRPHNMGANGLIFDPALDPLFRPLYWGAGIGTITVGGYYTYEFFNGDD